LKRAFAQGKGRGKGFLGVCLLKKKKIKKRKRGGGGEWQNLKTPSKPNLKPQIKKTPLKQPTPPKTTTNQKKNHQEKEKIANPRRRRKARSLLLEKKYLTERRSLAAKGGQCSAKSYDKGKASRRSGIPSPNGKKEVQKTAHARQGRGARFSRKRKNSEKKRKTRRETAQ